MEARQPEKPLHFLMERPLTPIYERINRAFKDTLEELGHKVTYFDPSQFESYYQALSYFFEKITSQFIDSCIITSSSKLFYSYFQDAKVYLFELIEAQLIFIHHDDISHNFTWKGNFYSTLQALLRVKDRSLHFCIENSNCLDLKSMGFEHVYPILHASEFKFINFPKEYSYTLSFVGHILPELGNSFKVLPYAHLLESDFESRLVKLDKKLKPSAVSFANQMVNLDKSLDFFKEKFFYIAAMNLVSPCFRGELVARLISKLDNLNLDIFGGDPSYLHGKPPTRIINNKNIKYHDSTNYCETQYVYANSKINLNITALQFDDAVVNRVIDVGAVGGFILTDWKPGLQNLTSVYKEISYTTIDELTYKINYFLSHEEERVKIAEQLHQDIIDKCSYSYVVNFIVSKVSSASTEGSKALHLDIGWESWKSESFVEVDNSPWSEANILADSNKDFSFQDSVGNESPILEDISKQLRLREINLVIFPDWLQPEELLLADLTDVIRELCVHPNKSQITLLVDTRKSSNYEVNPELVLSSIIINLSLNEGLTITEDGLEISLIPVLTREEWEALLPQIYGRLLLKNEDVETIERLEPIKILSLNLFNS